MIQWEILTELNYRIFKLKISGFIMESGKMEKEMDREYSNGMMGLFMKVIGLKIRLMEKENW